MQLFDLLRQHRRLRLLLLYSGPSAWPVQLSVMCPGKQRQNQIQPDAGSQRLHFLLPAASIRFCFFLPDSSRTDFYFSEKPEFQGCSCILRHHRSIAVRKNRLRPPAHLLPGTSACFEKYHRSFLICPSSQDRHHITRNLNSSGFSLRLKVPPSDQVQTRGRTFWRLMVKYRAPAYIL